MYSNKAQSVVLVLDTTRDTDEITLQLSTSLFDKVYVDDICVIMNTMGVINWNYYDEVRHELRLPYSYDLQEHDLRRNDRYCLYSYYQELRSGKHEHVLKFIGVTEKNGSPKTFTLLEALVSCLRLHGVELTEAPP